MEELGAEGGAGEERRTRKELETEAGRRMTVNSGVNRRHGEGERGNEKMEEERKGKKIESQRGTLKRE